MSPLRGSVCAVCGEALTSPLFAGRPDALCGLCQRAHPPFERAVAYGSYEGGLKELIHLLKFERVRPAARVLGRMLAEAMAKLDPGLPSGTVSVVPVPLHKRKQAERGFNHAELVAKAALKKLARPGRFELAAGVLVRRRETASQIGLTSHQRRVNLRGAFSVVDPTQVAGKNILLVDDVLTTGTTASECAKVLRRAGASGVWAVTVARTLKVGNAWAREFQEGENEQRQVTVVNA